MGAFLWITPQMIIFGNNEKVNYIITKIEFLFINCFTMLFTSFYCGLKVIIKQFLFEHHTPDPLFQLF
jgi:hypothetical protein